MKKKKKKNCYKLVKKETIKKFKSQAMGDDLIEFTKELKDKMY